MLLVDLLRGTLAGELSADRLVGLVQVLPEADNGYTQVMRRGRKESVWPGQVAARYGNHVAHVLQRLVGDEFDYFGRFKRASILWDWISGTPLDESKGDIRLHHIKAKSAPSGIDRADMMDAVFVHHDEAFSFRRRSMAQTCSSEMA